MLTHGANTHDPFTRSHSLTACVCVRMLFAFHSISKTLVQFIRVNLVLMQMNAFVSLIKPNATDEFARRNPTIYMFIVEI